MLREDQIVRYGRQILLREVGGAGQEKLCATPVRVVGEGEAAAVARAYLEAGGTPAGGSLAVRVGSLGGRAAVVWGEGGPPLDACDDAVVGALAALAAQERVLGLAPEGRGLWLNADLTTEPIP